MRFPDRQTLGTVTIEGAGTFDVVMVRQGSEPAAGLREAVLYGPPIEFPNLPHHPTGPDVLDAVAYWMDGVDDRDGNPNRDVQAHLREWANRLRAALAATPTASPTEDAEASWNEDAVRHALRFTDWSADNDEADAVT